MSQKKRLFVDMDGTLAVFRHIQVTIKEIEEAGTAKDAVYRVLKSPGYFSNLAPQTRVVAAINQLVEHDQIEVYILTSYITDSNARAEKNEWLDRYCPGIDREHRIFVPDGENKAEYAPQGIRENDFLLDDYTKNLDLWEKAGGHGIKLLNGINGTKGTWNGPAVNYQKISDKLFDNLENIVCHSHFTKDSTPDSCGRIREEDYEL